MLDLIVGLPVDIVNHKVASHHLLALRSVLPCSYSTSLGLTILPITISKHSTKYHFAKFLTR